MKFFRYFAPLALLAFLFGSCEEFLTREPVSSLTPSTFFTNERELALYANSFYNALPSGENIVMADEMGDFSSKTISPAYIAGSYTSVNEGAWSWSALRNINYFLDHAGNEEIPEEVRLHYQGLARFFRAYFYFDKVKTYGDVPWYDHALSTSQTEELYKPRDPRTTVMDLVLADLDFACQNIRDTKDNTASTVTRTVALAFKSRVCLHEGTYRKYHTELGLTASADQWLTEAAEAAEAVMDKHNYQLHDTDSPETDYRELFVSENLSSDEVIWGIVYNNALKKWHAITWKFNSATYGSRWSLNRQFIHTYLMRDGSRFTDRTGYDEMVFVDEMQGRDARLGQTIRSLGNTNSAGPAPANLTFVCSGYHPKKFSLDEKRLETIGESYNSVPMIRYAEVLLNYAEALAELGRMDENVWNETIAPLRDRAGVDAAAPTGADPYLQRVYFPEISDRWLLEVRRERGIELVYEGFRYQDLMRWKKGRLLEMQWQGIYVPAMNEPMDLDGNGTPDVCFITAGQSSNVPGVIDVVIDNSALRLSEGTHGILVWRDDETRVFDDKKYLHPISNADRTINPDLGQNPGWE